MKNQIHEDQVARGEAEEPEFVKLIDTQDPGTLLELSELGNLDQADMDERESVIRRLIEFVIPSGARSKGAVTEHRPNSNRQVAFKRFVVMVRVIYPGMLPFKTDAETAKFLQISRWHYYRLKRELNDSIYPSGRPQPQPMRRSSPRISKK